ncbi:hypothetical protein GGF46_002451 [Coemansia sp. RSA 552]|nr:hypothetical protein GGF46_002451 [Coemansia sp. RSA 552]
MDTQAFEEQFRTTASLDGGARASEAELITLLRAAGSVLSDAEIQRMAQPGGTDLQGFIQMLQRGSKTADQEQQEVEEAFHVFDKNNVGYLTTSELRRIMTTMGEKLTNQEVDEMLAEAGVGANDNFDYRAFSKMLFN